VGAALSALCAFPMFWLIDTRVTGQVVLGVTLGRQVLSIPYAVAGYLLAELFPPRLRYSGVALSINVAAVVAGFVPLIASARWWRPTARRGHRPRSSSCSR
jgi:MFS family permease